MDKTIKMNAQLVGSRSESDQYFRQMVTSGLPGRKWKMTRAGVRNNVRMMGDGLTERHFY